MSGPAFETRKGVQKKILDNFVYAPDGVYYRGLFKDLFKGLHL